MEEINRRTSKVFVLDLDASSSSCCRNLKTSLRYASSSAVRARYFPLPLGCRRSFPCLHRRRLFLLTGNIIINIKWTGATHFQQAHRPPEALACLRLANESRVLTDLDGLKIRSVPSHRDCAPGCAPLTACPAAMSATAAPSRTHQPGHGTGGDQREQPLAPGRVRQGIAVLLARWGFACLLGRAAGSPGFRCIILPGMASPAGCSLNHS
jgi:hypothetical protein